MDKTPFAPSSIWHANDANDLDVTAVTNASEILASRDTAPSQIVEHDRERVTGCGSSIFNRCSARPSSRWYLVKVRDICSTLTIRVPSGRGQRLLAVIAYSRFRHLFVTACAAQLADDPVECRGHTLCPADLVLLPGGIPVEFEWPAFGAMR